MKIRAFIVEIFAKRYCFFLTLANRFCQFSRNTLYLADMSCQIIPYLAGPYTTSLDVFALSFEINWRKHHLSSNISTQNRFRDTQEGGTHQQCNPTNGHTYFHRGGTHPPWNPMNRHTYFHRGGGSHRWKKLWDAGTKSPERILIWQRVFEN